MTFDYLVQSKNQVVIHCLEPRIAQVILRSSIKRGNCGTFLDCDLHVLSYDNGLVLGYQGPLIFVESRGFAGYYEVRSVRFDWLRSC